MELAGRVSGKAVLFPHAGGADLSTIGELEHAGADVSAVEVYVTTPVPPALDPVDAAIFGSPSAVEGWFRSRSLDDVVVAAIGATTNEALAHRGRPADLVPNRPDYGSLLEMLSATMRERSTV
jgi:uroporphyrinogen-III synthase